MPLLLLCTILVGFVLLAAAMATEGSGDLRRLGLSSRILALSAFGVFGLALVGGGWWLVVPL